MDANKSFIWSEVFCYLKEFKFKNTQRFSIFPMKEQNRKKNLWLNKQAQLWSKHAVKWFKQNGKIQTAKFLHLNLSGHIIVHLFIRHI